MRSRFALLSLGFALFANHASADSFPFVVINDNDTTRDLNFNDVDSVYDWMDWVMDEYLNVVPSSTRAPKFFSLWTTFPVGGESYGTRFLPLSNDVKGIGMENFFGRDGLYNETYPVRAFLMHNNVLELEARAAQDNADVSTYGDYLFLLELGHSWNSFIHVPGADPDVLIGFTAHWSFWMDQPSADGGQGWIDNHDGTFTSMTYQSGELNYSNLDLYLMGLIPATDVLPFGVLTNVPTDNEVPDPHRLNASANAQTFPIFGDTAYTVTATRQEFTIDDVVMQNGPRVPAYSATDSHELDVAFILMTPKDATAAERFAFAQQFASVQDGFAPAYARATQNKGSLRNITSMELENVAPPQPDAGVPEDASVGAADATSTSTHDDDSGGCSVSAKSSASAQAWWFALIAAAIARIASRRHRRA